MPESTVNAATQWNGRRAAMVDSFVQTLDLTAFVATEPTLDARDVPTDAVIVSMRFSGSFQATMEMVTSARFGESLAASIIGADPSDPQVAQASPDALKEVINVTVGAMIPRVARDANDFFDLDIPSLLPFDTRQWAAFTSDENTVLLDADGNTVALRLRAA